MAPRRRKPPRPRLPSTLTRALQQRLVRWYRRHARDLPWRRTRDPYRILVSEVMLQQTQVGRVIPYYGAFIRRYPTPAALAAAPESAVREAWDGLGYYARARNLHAAARQIVAEFGGRIPDDPAAIRRLPGVGRYTAGAVLSIAFGRDAAILDTNAARVLTRYYGLGARGRHRGRTPARLWQVAEAVTPAGQAGAFNQAIMDLGATVCLPREPRCPACPLRLTCRSAPRRPRSGRGAQPAAQGRPVRKCNRPS